VCLTSFLAWEWNEEIRVQKVPLARRFALLPLGPPSLRYSSVCKAMFKHNDETQDVTLETDRSYKRGMLFQV
jgi:hypothetical protein